MSNKKSKTNKAQKQIKEIENVFKLFSKKKWIPLILAIAALLTTFYIQYLNSNTEKQIAYVTKVVDGDTLTIDYNGKSEKLRLIGVDTPESVHPDANKNSEYGTTASEFTKQYLENKTIEIEFDVSEKDKYGRLLAYVYVDGIMFNETLLKEGYAKLATYPPNVKYVDNFTKLQEEARNNKKGLWAEDVF